MRRMACMCPGFAYWWVPLDRALFSTKRGLDSIRVPCPAPDVPSSFEALQYCSIKSLVQGGKRIALGFRVKPVNVKPRLLIHIVKTSLCLHFTGSLPHARQAFFQQRLRPSTENDLLVVAVVESNRIECGSFYRRLLKLVPYEQYVQPTAH